MQDTNALKLLFIINKSSGKDDKDWPQLIQDHFKETEHCIDLYVIPDNCVPKDIKQKANEAKPDKIVAVGGDGTVKLAAQCCMEANIPLCILPAGSANGMAKELGIPADPKDAMTIITDGCVKKIHLVEVNGELCIHLSDIGFNAFMMKKFETFHTRGMWGYAKALWQVLRIHSYMQVEIKVDGEKKRKRAAMIVIANATKYGTGALINPDGTLEDDKFEVIVMKKISLLEIFKMMVTHRPYNPAKTEVYQTGYIQINSKKKAHFQVDGEYLGKVNHVKACIKPDALEVVVPAEAHIA